jgi:tetratricopeptide (TPR) repeat protein
MKEMLNAVSIWAKPVYYFYKIGVGLVKFSKSKLEKEFITFKFLKKWNLVKLTSDFDSIYYHTLFNLSESKTKEVIKLFSIHEVKESLRKQICDNVEWSFKVAFDHHLHTNIKLIKIKRQNVDIDFELSEFIEEFKKTTNKARTPGEIETNQAAKETFDKVTALDRKVDVLQPALIKLLGNDYSRDLNYPKELIEENNHVQALKYLHKFKEEKWDNSNDLIKYKLLTNIGICQLQLFDEAQAAGNFIEALKYNPNDEKAISNASLGYTLKGNKFKFQELFAKAKELEIESELLFTCLILNESKEVELTELVEKIPTSFLKSSQICYSICSFAKEQRSKVEALKWLLLAIENNIDSDKVLFNGTLGTVLLELIIEPFDILSNEIDSDKKNYIEKAIQLLTDAWDKIKDTDLRKSRYFWLLNRGIAKKFINDLKGAYDDIKEAAKYDNSIITLRHFGMICIEIGEKAEGIKIFKSIIELQTHELKEPPIELFLAETYLDNKDFDKAIAILDDLESKYLLGEREVIEKDSILVRSFINLGKVEQAITINEKAKRDRPQHLVTYFDSALISNQQEKYKEADLYLLKAKSLLTEATRRDDILFLGNLLFHHKLYADAIDVYEKCVYKNVDSQQLFRLIDSYCHINDYVSALKICDDLRKQNSKSPTLYERNMMIYSLMKNPLLAIEVGEEYISFDDKNPIINLRLAGLYFNTDNKAKCSSCLDRIKDFDVLPIDALFNLSLLYCKLDNLKLALEIAYDVRRNHYENPKVHDNFIKILMNSGSEITNFLQAEKVDIGTAVSIEYEKGKGKTYIIEERSDASIKMDELKRTDPIAMKLLGKKVGDKIELKSEFDITSEATIVAITSKFSYARDKSFDLLQLTFPEQSSFHVLNFSDEKGGFSAKKFSEFIEKQIEKGAEQDKVLKNHYCKREITIGFYSKAKGVNLIELWGSLCKPDYGIFSSLINGDEIKNGISILNTAGAIVIDAVSLLTLDVIGALNFLTNFDNKIIIAESTVEIFKSFIQYYEGIGLEGTYFFSKEEGQLTHVHLTKEQIRRHVEHAKLLLDWINKNCQICSYKGSLKTNKSKSGLLGKYLGDSVSESIFLSIENNALLYCEESLVRAVAHQEYKVNGINTQGILFHLLKKKVFEKRKYDELISSLLGLGYIGLMIDSEILFKTLEDSKFVFASPFTNALEILKGKNSLTEPAIGVSAGFLKLVYLNIYTTENRKMIVDFVLNSITTDRNVEITLFKLKLVLNNYFMLLPKQRDELISIIDQWVES